MGDENQILRYVRAVESVSEHPIAMAIVNAIAPNELTADVKVLSGYGLEGIVETLTNIFIDIAKPLVAHHIIPAIIAILITIGTKTPETLSAIRAMGAFEFWASKEGDTVLVKAGESFCCDGIISEGTSNVNESMLTNPRI